MVEFSSTGLMKLVDVRTGNVAAEFQSHNNELTDAIFMPDGNRMLTGCRDREMVRVWDVETQRLLLNLEGEGRRTYLSVSEKGNVIVARGHGPVNVWTAPSWEEINAEEAAHRVVRRSRR